MHTAILCIISVKISSAQIQEIVAPKLDASENYQPWGNPGPPYQDTKDIYSAADERSDRSIGDGDYKLFLPGLGIVKDYIPTQAKRPERQSIKSRLL